MSQSSAAPTDVRPDVIELDDLSEHLEILRQVQSRLGQLGELRSDLQRKIKARLGDVEIGTVGGLPAVTWKRTLRVALSQKLLKAQYPEVLHDCEEISEIRTFLLVDAP